MGELDITILGVRADRDRRRIEVDLEATRDGEALALETPFVFVNAPLVLFDDRDELRAAIVGTIGVLAI